MGVSKTSSLFGKAIHIGGLHLGGAVATDVAISQVVDEDEDDVGRFPCSTVRVGSNRSVCVRAAL